MWTTRLIVLVCRREPECVVGWRIVGNGRRSGKERSEPDSRCVDIFE